ncbi:MAG: SDR family oxidoreductase [Actinomycetota bacterium]|nr:SDR family oxidoreductase [Actinomycetota bacterium]
MASSSSAETAKTVLTTGANSGIGLATALAVARKGYHSVGSVRSAAKANVVKTAAKAAGVDVETVLLDVTDPERSEEVIDQLKPWGLVNNAGYGMTGAIEDVGEDEARALFDTMVMAPMRLCRLAIPHQRQAGEGRIVNMSSIFGLTSFPLVGWYAGAKHALEALSDAMRVEVAGDGIKVVLVEPGGIKTNIWDDLNSDLERRSGSRFEGAYRRSLSGTRLTAPLMGSPDQVAKAVVRGLTSRIPQDRYLVGWDARAGSLFERLTPTAVRDIAGRLGLGI